MGGENIADRRTPATGHEHEAAFYTSDAEFRDLIVPFVEDGVAAGEPVILGYDERKSRLLRDWLTDTDGATFVTDHSLYRTPAVAIRTNRGLFEQHVAAGAARIRIAGDVPHAGNGGRFDGWDRYEAAVNTVWDDYPVRSLCLYHGATTAPQVRQVVQHTHPRLLTAGGHRHDNDAYRRPEAFTGLPPAPDPLEDTPPAVELYDPPAREARHVLAAVAPGSVDRVTVDDLTIGIGEAVTNAHIHGRAPVTVRVWHEPGRVVVHVRDAGSGPPDPLAGLVPATDTITGSGLGLWLMHQLEVDVALIRGQDSFTLRLRGGRLPAPSA